MTEGVIDTDYGQLDLAWTDEFGFDGDSDAHFARQVNGLAGAASGGGVYLTLARRSGGSQLAVVLHDSEPPLPADSWEDVVEVSTEVSADAEPRWTTWAGEDSGALSIPSGTYRVRVSARGRDAGRDGEFADEVVDWYLVELWPAPHTADAIVRVGSADAAYWHNERGSRR